MNNKESCCYYFGKSSNLYYVLNIFKFDITTYLPRAKYKAVKNKTIKLLTFNFFRFQIDISMLFKSKYNSVLKNYLLVKKISSSL